MEKEISTRAGLLAFLANVFLFLIKLAAGLLSGSLAILSDAFNSFLDILSYLLAFFSIKVAQKGPDSDHPFGHRRAEPLSALLIAIFAGVLAFEILRASFTDLISGETSVIITPLIFAIVLLSMLVKAAMYVFLNRSAKKSLSSTLEALAIDSRNDILATSIVLFGVAGAYMGYPFLDNVAAILIALFIFHSGYQIAKKNINYLMGASPDSKTLSRLWNTANAVKGVIRISILRAHYVGDRVHVEVGIVLSKKTKTEKTHDIAEKVQEALEKLPEVSRAFVHIDYE